MTTPTPPGRQEPPAQSPEHPLPWRVQTSIVPASSMTYGFIEIVDANGESTPFGSSFRGYGNDGGAVCKRHIAEVQAAYALVVAAVNACADVPPEVLEGKRFHKEHYTRVGEKYALWLLENPDHAE